MTKSYFMGCPLSRWVGLLGCLLLLLSAGRAQAQAFTITGRVLDARGQGLPGATILVRGTGLGTATNSEGVYALSGTQPAGDYVLAASLIGYKSESQPVVLGPGTTVTTDFTLAESRQNLDEIVVVGSTVTQSRRELGNAISTVSAADIAQSGSGLALNALQGKVPGAQIVQNSGDPAGSVSVRLRGIHSLSGPSDPLYVIDGVIISNASVNVSQTALASSIGRAEAGQNRLADLNPNDIATLSVINGAAAAAQYGSRAANGVVLITTKRGQTGAPRVSVSTSVNINELRKSVPINLFNKQFGSVGLRLGTITGLTDLQAGFQTSLPPTYTPLPGETFTRIVRAGAGSSLRTNLVDVTRYNYFDQIFQRGFGTDNSLSIAGGSDRTQYFVSANYLKNQGIIRGTDFTRYNLRARVDQRLTDWAKLSAGVAYSNSFSNEKANGNVFYSPINSVNITNNIFDITQRDVAGNLLAVEPSRVNPLSTIEDMKFTQGVSRTISDVQLSLNPFKGFSASYVLGVDAFSQVGQSYIRPAPYAAAAGLPDGLYPNGYAANANNVALQLNSDLNLGYEYNVNEDLKLNFLAGYSYQYTQNDYSITQGRGLAPSITTISGASSTTVNSAYNRGNFDLTGYYGQATVGFRNLAFLTGSLRRDRSSKFSASETNQYYPKISASLVVSDLGAWKNAGFASTFGTFKLRTSYGEAGSLAGIGDYDRIYQVSPVALLGRSTLLPNARLANARVRPDRNAEIEGGADLGFFNDRVGLGITAYYQKITDLTVARTVAASTGGSSLLDNVGSMENRGVEIQLNLAPIRTTDLRWDVSFIYNRNRNKVTDLLGSGGDVAILIDNSAGVPAYLLNGQPVGVFFGSAYARNPDGSLLLTPQGLRQDERTIGQPTGSPNFTPARGSDGQPSYALGTPASGSNPALPGSAVANVIIGDPNPKWTGSFNSNLSYKKLTMHVLLDAVRGVSVFNADRRTRQGVGIGGQLAEQELRGNLPRGYTFALYNTQEFRIEDGSYVKLREIALSYSLPSFSKAIQDLTLSVVGRNLYSWDTYDGFDPETNAGGTSDLLRSVDFGNVPIPRSYQLKLSASF